MDLTWFDLLLDLRPRAVNGVVFITLGLLQGLVRKVSNSGCFA